MTKQQNAPQHLQELTEIEIEEQELTEMAKIKITPKPLTFKTLLNVVSLDICRRFEKFDTKNENDPITGSRINTATFPDWLCVIDIDIKKEEKTKKPQPAALDFVARLYSEKLKDLAAPIIKTPSGGLHIYTRRSSQNMKEKTEIKKFKTVFFDVDVFYRTEKSGHIVIPPTEIKTAAGYFGKYEILQDREITATESYALELLGLSEKNENEKNENEKNENENGRKFEQLTQNPGTVFFLDCWIESKAEIHNWCEYSENEQKELSLHSLFSRVRYVFSRECEIYKKAADFSKLYAHLMAVKSRLNLTENAARSFVYRMKYNEKTEISTPARFLVFPALLLKFSGWSDYSEKYKNFIKTHEKLRPIFEQIPEKIKLPEKIEFIELQKFGSANLSEIIKSDFNDVFVCLSALSSCVRMDRRSGDWFVSECGEVWTWKDSRMRKELIHIKTRFTEKRKNLNLWEILTKYHHLIESNSVKFYSEKVEEISIFRGYKIEPAKNDDLSAFFVQFVKDLTSSENDDICAELLNWAAFILQNPNGMTGTVPILTGKQGCGKSTLANVFFKLFAPYSEKLNTLASISSQFTGNLEGKKFIQIEEIENVSEFSSSIENKLKGYITDDTICIEKKGLERYTAENVANFMGTSNYASPVRITANNRRFWVVKCSGDNIGKNDYWRKIHETFNRPEFLPAVMWFLMHLDLSEYNPHKLPQTVGNELINETHEDRAAFLLWQHLEEFEQIKGFYVLEKSKIENTRENNKILNYSEICAIERKMINGRRAFWIIMTAENFEKLRHYRG